MYRKIVASLGLDIRFAVILATGVNAIAISYRYFVSIIFDGIGKNGSSVAVSASLKQKLLANLALTHWHSI